MTEAEKRGKRETMIRKMTTVAYFIALKINITVNSYVCMHVARMRNKRNSYKILEGNSRRKETTRKT
jgi:hypothetical protein